jgi:hypothetical protein
MNRPNAIGPDPTAMEPRLIPLTQVCLETLAVVPSGTWLEINLRQTNYTILCDEIKLLIDWFCSEGFPAIDFAHVGLAGSK